MAKETLFAANSQRCSFAVLADLVRKSKVRGAGMGSITKRFMLAATAALLLSGQIAVIEAQVIYNTGGTEMLNTMMNNTMNTIRTKDMTDPMTVGARLQAGAAKIKAGKATTNFTSTRAGTEALVKTLKFESHVPQDFAGQTAFVQKYISLFNQLAAQNGITVNDYADGTAFAQAIAYAAYHNRDMNKTDFQQLRKSYRDYLLKDTYFQGMNDDARQSTYDLHALLAMQAAEQRAKARMTTDGDERQEFSGKAKYFAGMLLDVSKEK